MLIQDILRAKGSEVCTIGPEATLTEVVRVLVGRNIGSLVVTNSVPETMEPRVVGIITERDILRAQAADRAALSEQTVAQVMTTRLFTACPTDRLECVMGLMTEKRVRHLPVLVEDRLVGLISIGDVVKAQHQEATLENEWMRSYIHGESSGAGLHAEQP
jgi:CBS domain-containing protein